MIHTCILAVLLLGLSQAVHAQDSKGKIQNDGTSARVEKLITEKLHAMYEAEKKRDLKFIFSNMTEDFEEVGGDGGTYHRSDIEAAWNDVELNDYRLSDCNFKLVTKEVAYQTCLMDGDATYKGKPIPSRLRVTWWWTEVDGNWLLKFEQGTIVPGPAKTDTGK